MAVDDRWPPFGVIGDEVEGGSCRAGRVIPTRRAVLQELTQEGGGSWIRRTGRCRPANPGGRKRALHRAGREVVQLVKFFRRAMPVSAVRLAPNLPVPQLDVCAAVSFDRMPNPLV